MSTATLRAPHVADIEFYQDVIAGLSQKQKSLPCKYFYDAAGSVLFEKICRLEEYYVTRTEIAILKRHLPEMAQWIGEGAHIVEFGAGAGVKTALLLAALDKPAAYMPVEISETALVDCAHRLHGVFPQLAIKPVHADYMDDRLFQRLAPQQKLTVFFPGSTLGNFEAAEAHAFLSRMRRLIGEEGGLLIGVDMMKDERILLPAYNDREGITAAFNKNLLARINQELGGNFNLSGFEHKAIVNHEKQRVEMYLMSLYAQRVLIGEHSFRFIPGEMIHTEHSHKYTLEGFAALAESAGLQVKQSWMDEAKLFSVQYLTGR